MVIELANEVRKVLDEGIPKERKLVGPPHIPHKSHMPTLQLHALPEAIAMDSS